MNPSPTALLRYQAISAYLALDPPRGKRGPTLRKLASKAWVMFCDESAIRYPSPGAR